MKKISFLIICALFLSCSGDDDSSCTGAASASGTALVNFQGNNSDANCLALENQRDVCGSLSSSLAGTLADLSCN